MAITTSTVNAPPSGTNPILVASGVTVSATTGDVQGVMLVDPDSASLRVASITANGLKVDGSAVTQPVSAASLPLPTGAAQDGTDGTGITQTTGGVGIRGWLSGIYKTLIGVVSVAQDGCTYLNITDATLHSVTAGKFVGFQNLSGTAQTVSITAYDGTTATTAICAPMILGAGQIITLPLGGIKSTSGSLAFQCSGAPTTGIQALYHA